MVVSWRLDGLDAPQLRLLCRALDNPQRLLVRLATPVNIAPPAKASGSFVTYLLLLPPPPLPLSHTNRCEICRYFSGGVVGRSALLGGTC